MSLYTVIGDPHCKPNNLSEMGTLFGIVEDTALPTIWLGDLLDTKEVIRGKCLNAYLNYFKRSKLDHIVLVGNHDWFNLECKEHSLEPLKDLENVTIVDSPISHNGMLFLPYIHGGDAVREALGNLVPKVVKKDFPILVAHLEVTGFDFGNGHICEAGLGLEDLKMFDLVVSGHFHKFQEKGNLVYLGTPFSHSFGESNQTKFIAILDSETQRLEYIATPFAQHLTIEIDADKVSTIRKVDTKNHVRIILTGRPENIAKVNKDEYPDVKFIERPDETLEGEISISETASNEEKFQTWAEGKSISKETIALGLEIMKGVGG